MNKKILVTGASGNLGRVVSQKLKTSGMQIHATVSSQRSANALKGEGFSTQILDLTSEEAVKAHIAEIGESIDAAVLLVGGFAMGGFKEADGESLKKMYTLNFETTYFIVKELLPFFANKGKGQFILIGSRPALKAEDGKDLVAYALSKSLIFQLSEMVNAFGKDKNIQSTVLVPSTLDTKRNRESIPDADFSHWVSLDAVADTIHFLLTESGEQVRESVIKLYHQS